MCAMENKVEPMNVNENWRQYKGVHLFRGGKQDGQTYRCNFSLNVFYFPIVFLFFLHI